MKGRNGTRTPRSAPSDGCPMHLLIPAVLWGIGCVVGYFAAGRCAEQTNEELRRCVEGSLAAAGDSLSASAAAETLLCYFRAPAAAFLFGLSPLGAIFSPLVCALQGFSLSFSLFCFAAALGRGGFRYLPALFALRFAVTAPCTLAVGSAALRRSAPGAEDLSYWYRFGTVCVCLLLGSALELWLAPRLLAALG